MLQSVSSFLQGLRDVVALEKTKEEVLSFFFHDVVAVRRAVVNDDLIAYCVCLNINRESEQLSKGDDKKSYDLNGVKLSNMRGT